jgi:acetate kinase
MSFILTINAGSSSVKTAVFSESLDNLLELDLGLSDKDTHCSVFKSIVQKIMKSDIPGLKSPSDFGTISHRIVHGGDSEKPMIITEDVIKHIEELTSLAPL